MLLYFFLLNYGIYDLEEMCCKYTCLTKNAAYMQHFFM